MQISKATAANLIQEISAIIDYDINIMNETGTIIASTDLSRVDQFHEGAHRIITQDLDELLVYYDEEYDGCKKGINLPITMDAEIIGVIGITGEVEETIRYARLIRKVTEILMKDLSQLQKQSRRQQARMLFVSSWLNGDIDNAAEVEETLNKYHLNPGLPFAVALIEGAGPQISVEKFLSAQLDSTGFIASFNGDSWLIIGNFTSAQKCHDSILSSLCPHFTAEDFICSISSCCSTYEAVPQAYREAQKVMALARKQGHGFYLYDDFLLEVIMEDVPKHYRKQFVSQIFGNCQRNEILDFSQFIRIYYANNGSINSIAKQTFVHKNTVQYKINKIRNQTGMDLRVLKDLHALYLAAMWCDD